MKPTMRIVILVGASICPAVVLAQDLCTELAGAAVVAQDGEYLGRVESSFRRDSILNEYGPHGSEYSRTSIWNEYGPYGGEYSRMSPFNAYTSTPPMLIVGGNVVAYLTVNETVAGAVNPFALKACE